MCSNRESVVFSLTFGPQKAFILQLDHARSLSQRNTNVRPPRSSSISRRCGFNRVAVMYDTLHTRGTDLNIGKSKRGTALRLTRSVGQWRQMDAEVVKSPNVASATMPGARAE